MARPHLVISINVDWFFLSHRLNFARRLVREGWQCTVVAADTGASGPIREAGLGFRSVPLSRSGTNPLDDLRLVAALASAYRDLCPTLVHQMTIKPVIYGSLAARRVGVPVVNHVTGLGYTFTAAGTWSPMRRLVERLYRPALGYRRSLAMFENPDDRALFVQRGLVRADATRIVRGCGVDVDAFAPSPLPPGPPVAMLPARLLRDKGVGEFVEAARMLRDEGLDARFVLVGEPDPVNPASVSAGDVGQWVRDGHVESWGRSETMPETLTRAHVVVLPSYREGLPKVLIEAAAVGRPLVAADVPGCREVVAPGLNGLLVAPRSPRALAQAMGTLLRDPERMQRYGNASRRIATTQFSDSVIAEETLGVYAELLGDSFPAPGGGEKVDTRAGCAS